jgi:hypothetical protein
MEFFGRTQQLHSFALSVLIFICSTQTTSAQDFDETGRTLLYGYGDTTNGLQRDAETFGFVGRDFSGHVGIDIAAPSGTPVFAAAAGEVTSPGQVTQNTAREVVIIGEAATASDLMSYEFIADIQVVAGDRVRAGQLIGYIAPDHSELGGPHLHFGLAQSTGRRLHDPTPLLLDMDGEPECVVAERGTLSSREGGYEENRVRRVLSGSLDKPALLFPVECNGN